jgi:hypothetical protein
MGNHLRCHPISTFFTNDEFFSQRRGVVALREKNHIPLLQYYVLTVLSVDNVSSKWIVNKLYATWWFNNIIRHLKCLSLKQ